MDDPDFTLDRSADSPDRSLDDSYLSPAFERDRSRSLTPFLRSQGRASGEGLLFNSRISPSPNRSIRKRRRRNRHLDSTEEEEEEEAAAAEEATRWRQPSTDSWAVTRNLSGDTSYARRSLTASMATADDQVRVRRSRLQKAELEENERTVRQSRRLEESYERRVVVHKTSDYSSQSASDTEASMSDALKARLTSSPRLKAFVGKKWINSPRTGYTYVNSLTYRDSVTPGREVPMPHMARLPLSKYAGVLHTHTEGSYSKVRSRRLDYHQLGDYSEDEAGPESYQYVQPRFAQRSSSMTGYMSTSYLSVLLAFLLYPATKFYSLVSLLIRKIVYDIPASLHYVDLSLLQRAEREEKTPVREHSLFRHLYQFLCYLFYPLTAVTAVLINSLSAKEAESSENKTVRRSTSEKRAVSDVLSEDEEGDSDCVNEVKTSASYGVLVIFSTVYSKLTQLSTFVFEKMFSVDQKYSSNKGQVSPTQNVPLSQDDLITDDESDGEIVFQSSHRESLSTAAESMNPSASTQSLSNSEKGLIYTFFEQFFTFLEKLAPGPAVNCSTTEPPRHKRRVSFAANAVQLAEFDDDASESSDRSTGVASRAADHQKPQDEDSTEAAVQVVESVEKISRLRMIYESVVLIVWSFVTFMLLSVWFVCKSNSDSQATFNKESDSFEETMESEAEENELKLRKGTTRGGKKSSLLTTLSAWYFSLFSFMKKEPELRRSRRLRGLPPEIIAELKARRRLRRQKSAAAAGQDLARADVDDDAPFTEAEIKELSDSAYGEQLNILTHHFQFNEAAEEGSLNSDSGHFSEEARFINRNTQNSSQPAGLLHYLRSFVSWFMLLFKRSPKIRRSRRLRGLAPEEIEALRAKKRQRIMRLKQVEATDSSEFYDELDDDLDSIDDLEEEPAFAPALFDLGKKIFFPFSLIFWPTKESKPLLEVSPDKNGSSLTNGISKESAADEVLESPHKNRKQFSYTKRMMLWFLSCFRYPKTAVRRSRRLRGLAPEEVEALKAKRRLRAKRKALGEDISDIEDEETYDFETEMEDEFESLSVAQILFYSFLYLLMMPYYFITYLWFKLLSVSELFFQTPKDEDIYNGVANGTLSNEKTYEVNKTEKSFFSWLPSVLLSNNFESEKSLVDESQETEETDELKKKPKSTALGIFAFGFLNYLPSLSFSWFSGNKATRRSRRIRGLGPVEVEAMTKWKSATQRKRNYRTDSQELEEFEEDETSNKAIARVFCLLILPLIIGFILLFCYLSPSTCLAPAKLIQKVPEYASHQLSYAVNVTKHLSNDAVEFASAKTTMLASSVQDFGGRLMQGSSVAISQITNLASWTYEHCTAISYAGLKTVAESLTGAVTSVSDGFSYLMESSYNILRNAYRSVAEAVVSSLKMLPAVSVKIVTDSLFAVFNFPLKIIVEASSSIGHFISSQLNSFAEIVSAAWEKLIQMTTGLQLPSLSEYFSLFGSKVGSMAMYCLDLFYFGWNTFTDLLQDMANWIQGKFHGGLSWITASFGNLAGSLWSPIGYLANLDYAAPLRWLSSTFFYSLDQIWTLLKSPFSYLPSSADVASKISDLSQLVFELPQKMLTWSADWLARATSAVYSVAHSTAAWAVSPLAHASKAVAEMSQQSLSVIKSSANYITEAVSAVPARISDAGAWTWSLLTGLLGNIYSAASSFFGGLLGYPEAAKSWSDRMFETAVWPFKSLHGTFNGAVDQSFSSAKWLGSAAYDGLGQVSSALGSGLATAVYQPAYLVKTAWNNVPLFGYSRFFKRTVADQGELDYDYLVEKVLSTEKFSKMISEIAHSTVETEGKRIQTELETLMNSEELKSQAQENMEDLKKNHQQSIDMMKASITEDLKVAAEKLLKEKLHMQAVATEEESKRDKLLDSMKLEYESLLKEFEKVKAGANAGSENNQDVKELEEQIVLLKNQITKIETDQASLRETIKDCCKNQTHYEIAVENYINDLLESIVNNTSDDRPIVTKFGAWISSFFVAKSELEGRLNLLSKELRQEVTDKSQEVQQAAKSEAQQTAQQLMATVSTRIREEYLSRQKVTTSANVDGLSKDEVYKIVRNALIQYDADKTGMFDYALETAGGSVVSTRCTETFVKKTAMYTLFGIPLWYPSNNPRTVIQPGVQPGECWAFKGSEGYVVIQLSGPVVPTKFSMEHIPKSMSPSGSVDSAPKDFRVLGLKAEKDRERHELGRYMYNDNSDPLQLFDVQFPSQEAFPFIELEILSNHGNVNYTCLYRFRVHGVLTADYNA